MNCINIKSTFYLANKQTPQTSTRRPSRQQQQELAMIIFDMLFGCFARTWAKTATARLHILKAGLSPMMDLNYFSGLIFESRTYTEKLPRVRIAHNGRQ